MKEIKVVVLGMGFIGKVHIYACVESVQRYARPGGSFPSPKLAGGWLRAHVHSMYDFLDNVNQNKPSRPDLRDGAYIQHVMQAAYESSQEGTWVQV